jgi:hypothetical protein
LPLCALPSHASAVCLRALLRAARPNRTTARRGRWACAWRGGTAPGYGSQVRLSGTALRYSYASHQRCLSGVSVIRPRALFPRPHRRTFRTHTDAHSKPIPTPTHAPSTHIPSCTLAFNFKHLPFVHTLELSTHFPRPHNPNFPRPCPTPYPQSFHALSTPT